MISLTPVTASDSFLLDPVISVRDPGFRCFLFFSVFRLCFQAYPFSLFLSGSCISDCSWFPWCIPGMCMVTVIPAVSRSVMRSAGLYLTGIGMRGNGWRAVWCGPFPWGSAVVCALDGLPLCDPLRSILSTTPSAPETASGIYPE